MRKSALCIALLSLLIVEPCSAQLPPPPPGGGSSGGGYTGPGGGSGSGGSTGGGGTGGSGGVGSGDVVGGSAIQNSDPATSGGEKCDGSDPAGGGGAPSGGGGLPQRKLVEETRCIYLDDFAADHDKCGCCGGGGGDEAIAARGDVGGGDGGCASCGGGSATNATEGNFTDYSGGRSFMPQGRGVYTSFGPGHMTGYDSKIFLYPDGAGGTDASFFNAISGLVYPLVDGLDGDVSDGVFHDQTNNSVKSFTIADATGSPVSDVTQAVAGVVEYYSGVQQGFDVLALDDGSGNPEYVARLSSSTDRNGRTLSIAYRDSLPAGSGGFTAQELIDAPDRHLQIHQITDWRGDIATYHYKSAQESGRWVVEKIDFPNGNDVDYAYTNGNLTSVTYHDGTAMTFEYGQDANAQTATVKVFSAGQGGFKTFHLTNDYMTLDNSGQSVVVNQPQGIYRMEVNGSGETEFMLVPDMNQANQYTVYEGTGQASEIIFGQSQRYWEDGWSPTYGGTGGLMGIEMTATTSLIGDQEPVYSSVGASTTADDLYAGTIPEFTDDTGRQYSYEYDADGFLTKKTFVADGTYEEYAYNTFKQVTRVRDRQGNVTLTEYDANGNRTKLKVGLKEVGGQDVAQPEYAEQSWAYYPVGHYAAGLLKTAYSPAWDGSSADTHRTDYEYDARGNITKVLSSASVGGGTRPETNYTYNPDDSVASTTDSEGHTVTPLVDGKGRTIRTTYDDGSTEETLYGADGSGDEYKILKTKNRRNVVTSYSYDISGRTTQVIVGTAWDADILDGQADDTPITDRNEQSITTYTYLDGTEDPITVVRDGSRTDFVYDYRGRVIETKVYPHANKILSSKVVYVDNNKFSDEDPYGRKKYYGYRASDGQLIRYVTGAYPSFSLADQDAVFNLVRDTNLNPDYTIKDAIADENGRPSVIIDERGTQSLTEFNAAGQVIRETKAVGTTVETITEMDYDDAGNVIEIRSPRYFDPNDTNGFQKCKTVMTYDGAGRVLTRTEAPGTPEAGTESYTYDAHGRQVTRTDARGKIWTTTYASCCGHSVASIKPLGHGSVTNQDNGGLVVHTAGIANVATHTSLLDPDNTKTLRETTSRYDALGRSIASCTWLVPQGLIDVENPPIAGFSSVAAADGLTTQTLYDVDLTDGIGLDSAAGISVTNPLGGTYTVSLSAALTKLAAATAQGGAGLTFDASTPGSAVVNLNAENEVSFSISDAQGRSVMSGILQPHDAVGGATPGDLMTWSCQVHDTVETIGSDMFLTSISVDALGHTSKARSNGLGHTLQSVDQAGFISTVQYDAGGNAIISRDPNNVGYDAVYDALGRSTSRTDTVGSVTQSIYDKAGQQVQAIDAKNKPTNYVFNARGQRTTEVDRLGFATHWAYDAGGNLLSLTDAEAQTTSYTYSDAGQRITEQYPDHIAGAVIGDAGYGIITFSYDALGRRTVKEDQQGDTTSYNFDMSGRMLTRVYVGHPTSPLAGQTDTDTFTYDRNGRMLSGIKGRYNNTVTFSYDDRGQQIEETLTTHGQTYTVGYQKNSLGRTTQLQYPDGSLVDRAYTDRGQLQSVKYTPNGGTQSNVGDFVYDAAGRETTRNLGNGLATTRSYFADNQIQSIATPTVETLTYTYDANKNPTSETRSGVMAPYSWTSGASGFDDEDRLTSWQRNNGNTRAWNLSAVHDWSTTTIDGQQQTRSHGASHEIMAMSGAGVNPSPNALTYDPKGNLTVDSLGCEIVWGFENLMQEFDSNALGNFKDATYTYDALDRRVSKSVVQANGLVESTVFTHAGGQTVCEYEAGNASTDSERRFIYGSYIDETILFVDSSTATDTLSYLHHDRQYSSSSLTGVAGQVQEYYAYDPYGEHETVDISGVPAGGATVGNHDVSFTGRRLDAESAKLHFRLRNYDTSLGEFMSRDPIGYSDGLNLYSAYFVPQTTDPSGLSRWTWEDWMNHYHNGFGRPISLREAGLGDFFERKHKTAIDSAVSGGLSHSMRLASCAGRKAGSYSDTDTTESRIHLNSELTMPNYLYPLGNSWPEIKSTHSTNWTCTCCDGKMKLTRVKGSVKVNFNLKDAFVNPFDGGADHGPTAAAQGQCTYECVLSYQNRPPGDVSLYLLGRCITNCRTKHPTTGDTGVPFGIFHSWSRERELERKTTCDSPLYPTGSPATPPLGPPMY